MQPNDREDSSNYAQPHPDAPEPVVVLPEPSKPKKSKAPVVLTLLLILAIAAAVCLGWLWFQQSGRVDNLESDLSVARNDVSRLKSASEAEAKLNSSLEEGAPLEVVSDKDQLIQLAKAYAAAEVNGNPATLKITVAKLNLPFARVDVSGLVGGAACVYKKAEQQWLRLYCAQGGSDDTMMMDATYGVPKSIIES